MDYYETLCRRRYIIVVIWYIILKSAEADGNVFGAKSAAGMMCFCRPAWKLASPWSLNMKANGIFPLDFELLQKISSVANKFVILHK